MESVYARDFSTTTRVYHQDLSKCEPLSVHEEKKLLKQCKRGDIIARNKVINGSLRFVFNMAKRYSGRGLPLIDLVSEGNLGLLKAIEKFDCSNDVRFITYAKYWVRVYMSRALKGRNTPNILEIETPELKEKAITTATCTIDDEDNAYYSCKDEDINYTTEHEDEETEMAKTHKKIVGKLLTLLNDRERGIIELLYGLNDGHAQTMTTLAKKYNVTVESIRQTKVRALNKMRDNSAKIVLKHAD